ncbi:DUF1643 domain-containing protein [Amycolatopsis sp. cmx-4-68]|uniref:DUF1643 domain-containing protein n=1 Tax=Amycolatopsis sp. cmx-4-68 TaxID=2790938 RepID=UPI00397B4AE6
MVVVPARQDPNKVAGSTLGAILLNPPVTAGRSTHRHVRIAAEILNCNDVAIGNLFNVSTRSVEEINKVGTGWSHWIAARPTLLQVITSSTTLLAGWGVSGLHGIAKKHLRQQISWLIEQVTASQHLTIWTINSQPRHPSRWHQYVSDKHGRTHEGSLHQRLTSVLVPVTPDMLRSKENPNNSI